MPSDRLAAGDDGDATAALIELIRAERQRIVRARFQGGDPSVAGPGGRTATSALARLVAADREGALLRAGDHTMNPSEDRAEDALQAAVNALTGWAFDAVGRELATAARLARDPARQQRTSAIRSLAGFMRALIYTTPGERLGSERQTFDRLLPTLDRLDADEREHYHGESERLAVLWREAAIGPPLWRRWALLRARLAQRVGADESAIAWTLRAWDHEQPSRFQPDPALATLIDAGRRIFAPLVTPGSDEPDQGDPPRARDVMMAVSAAILGHDAPDAAASRDPFAFVPYHAVGDATAEERPA